MLVVAGRSRITEATEFELGTIDMQTRRLKPKEYVTNQSANITIF